MRKIKLHLMVLFETLLSLLRVILFASIPVARRLKRISKDFVEPGSKCVILGNGPSLKDVLINKELEKGDYYAVNMFVKSDEFWTLKPTTYFLIDPYIFISKEDRAELLRKELIDSFSKVSWPMSLVVPKSMKISDVKKITCNNNINIVQVNCNDFVGYKPIRHWFYRHNLAMVPCQTVINAALMFALIMGYKQISLYGADHTWTKDLIVNDNNEVCYGDRHVYKTSVEYVKMNYNMGTHLEYFSKMFKSHYLIREYADSLGVKITNKTRGSFIDAYERN